MKNILFTLALILITSSIVFSQTPGTADPAFGDEGAVVDEVDGYFHPHSIAIQENYGDIFMVGRNIKIDPFREFIYIKKLDFYGNPINTFGENGVLSLTFSQSNFQQAYQIIPDHPNLGTKGFFLRGTYHDDNGNKIDYISKHKEDGSLDSSYGNEGILEISGQIDGNHIYSLTLNNDTGHQSFKRYNLLDGSLDESFSNTDLPLPDSKQHFEGSGMYNPINIQDNGKIILVGFTFDENNIKIPTVARFNSDGTFDTSFGEDGYYYGNNPYGFLALFESKTQSDGRIILSDSRYRLVRLNSNGTLDTTFGDNGTVLINPNYWCVHNLTIQDDDKILFSGEFEPIYFSPRLQYLTRLNPDGNIDFTYNSFESENGSDLTYFDIVGKSLILTAGVFNYDEENSTSVIQRIYASTPIISLFGEATNFSDIELETNDYIEFYGSIQLNEGPLKFRLDHLDSFNWGGFYPGGDSTMGINDIIIPESGLYDVSFNLKTGEFNFSTDLSTNDLKDNSVLIYPNPVKNNLNFNKTVSNVQIHDQSGRLIFTSNASTQFVDISNYSNGVYTISFTFENERIRKQFIKK